MDATTDLRLAVRLCGLGQLSSRSKTACASCFTLSTFWRSAWAAVLISYFLLPAPGARLANPLAPVNINYVYGFSDATAQTWMPGWAWLTI